MNAKLISFARLLVRILIVARQSPYPLNSTQNHLIHSTLRIFNLSTQPSIFLGSKSPITKKSESRKNTSNSRKCLVFTLFSVFNSVLLTAILRTRHERSQGTYPRTLLSPRGIPAPAVPPDPARGWWVYRKYRPCDPRRNR